MSGFSWIPGLVVLAAGLCGGVVLAWRLFGGGPKRDEDLDLEIRDLEGRRDELYRRLRDESHSLTEGEVEQLEQAAARTLRDLDAAVARTSTGSQSRAQAEATTAKGEAEEAMDESPVPATESVITRRPLISGFLLGAGMIAVVSLLIYWAVRDTAGTGTVNGPGAATGQAEVPHPDVDLPPDSRAEYEALQSQLAREPGDIMARKRLATLLLQFEQYFAAFEQARALLAIAPEDIDGLYVEAVVRLQMGQFVEAIEGFDRVIAQFPTHLQALAWKGIALFQLGDVEAAVSSWELGIEASGGSHPELEQMVAAAREEEHGQGGAAEPAPAPPPPPLPVATEGNVFLVRIDIEEANPPRGVLFVSLRSSSQAPPVAVRRIAEPVFPVTLTLTAEDSMMGAALPASGTLTARLDQDGDVSSVQSGDLAGSTEAATGAQTTLVLRR